MLYKIETGGVRNDEGLTKDESKKENKTKAEWRDEKGEVERSKVEKKRRERDVPSPFLLRGSKTIVRIRLSLACTCFVDSSFRFEKEDEVGPGKKASRFAVLPGTEKLVGPSWGIEEGAVGEERNEEKER
ncbi:uncharacterized protein SPSK_05664 [Sporothrix schenckii 1099-18]|uniref:Uncharacterized protein n=1 Tax=Sporothrix schenckii 1099-18 TaxID=1397361 RepID=A0A0F2LWI8_SPOSC|nr:uncharacterized protein SPSK_05664 [Sporothrix schenckii 1099-18]KJR80860.1 hypothetical protein SPSK_05664 [Sporothrix schenckii 1099-18]